MRRLAALGCLVLAACSPTGAAAPEHGPANGGHSLTDDQHHHEHDQLDDHAIDDVHATHDHDGGPRVRRIDHHRLGGGPRLVLATGVPGRRRRRPPARARPLDDGWRSPPPGCLDVHVDVADEVVGVFAALFDLRFPIERMEPVDAFDADDDRSMAANNTSGLNCRPVAGTSSWSQHAYGLAIDVNPVQNPWVPGDVHPPAGAEYLDRSNVRPGMVTGAVVEAFEAVGWGWGGRWSAPDYHHFSKTGR